MQKAMRKRSNFGCQSNDRSCINNHLEFIPRLKGATKKYTCWVCIERHANARRRRFISPAASFLS
jgi:hypothetical protein